MLISNAFAQTATATGAAPAQPGPLGMIMPFALMFGVIYFLIIRPQQKKMKEHQSTIDQIKHGDEVITNAGILGKVVGITDRILTVEIADNVRVKMIKTQISAVNPDLSKLSTQVGS